MRRLLTLRSVVALILFLMFAPSRPAAAAQLPELWVPNGTTSAAATFGDTLYLGGDFTHVGPSTGGLVKLDGSTGAVSPTFPRVDGIIYAITSDGAGGWFVGGLFTTLGSVQRRNAVHLLANGTIDPGWAPDPDSYVFALTVHEGSVFIGGDFAMVGGVARKNLAEVSVATGVPTSFNPAPGNAVWAIAATGTVATRRVYIGGDFGLVGATVRRRLAAFGTVAGALVLTAWDPDPDTGTVHALQVQVAGAAITVYAGGSFTKLKAQTASPVARANLAAIDGTGTGAIITAFAPSVTDGFIGAIVETLAITGNRLLVGGRFSKLGGQLRSSIGSVLLADGSVESWNPAGSSTLIDVRDILVNPATNTVHIAGDFTAFGGQPRRHLAAVSLSAGTLLPLTQMFENAILALGADGTNVIAGGSFLTVGGVDRAGLAAIDLTTGRATGWIPALGGSSLNPVRSIVLNGDGSTLYAGGGSFANADFSVTVNGAIALRTSDGQPVTFWNAVMGPDSVVRSMTLDGGFLYLAGTFNSVGATTRTGLVRVNPANGQLDLAWNPVLGFSGQPQVDTFAILGGVGYLGGQFTTVNGTPRSNIAAISLSSAALDAAWNPGANNEVESISISGSTIYAGGTFTVTGGVTRTHLAAYPAANGSVTVAPTSWNPVVNGTSVHTVAAIGGAIFAAGDFTQTVGLPRFGVAALNPAVPAGTPFAWTVDPAVSVNRAMLFPAADSLLIGGDFQARLPGSGHFLSVAEVIPRATTLPASGVSASGAVLNGSARANGFPTTAVVEYGMASGSYPNSVALSNLDGYTDTPFAATVNGIAPNTTIFFRTVATNTVGTERDTELKVTTLAVAPKATTLPATAIGSTTATLGGTVNANNSATTVTFEYGTSPGSYPNAIPVATPIGGLTDTPVSVSLAGLAPSTTLFYRVVAINSAGTVAGSELQFTTAPATIAIGIVYVQRDAF